MVDRRWFGSYCRVRLIFFLITPGYSLGVMLELVDLSSFVSDAWFSWDCMVRLALFGLFGIVWFGLHY